MYATVVGVLLLLFPSGIVSTLGMERMGVVGFARVGGALLTLVGYYYWAAARGEATGEGVAAFYRATVHGRLGLCVALAALSAMGCGCLGVGALGVMNAVGAAAMHVALRRRS